VESLQSGTELPTVPRPEVTQDYPTTTPAANGQTSKAAADNVASIGNIGRFELKQVLGSGGFGMVYRAYDPVLGRQVALKLPHFTGDDKNKIRRFISEAKSAARLRHPNIVAVFDAGQTPEGEYFIASEFIDGAPLSDFVGDVDSSLDVTAKVELIKQLALALAYAHGEGVIHRDVKPANVLVDSKHRGPQLADFGLAKQLDVKSSLQTQDGSVLGTPAYMAPEQARGQVAAVGPASDQYSLGVVLYELLTGSRPFVGAPHEVLVAVAGQREAQDVRTLNSSLPEDLAAVCMKAISKRIDDRYASCGEFAADLQRWLSDRPVAALPINDATRFWRWTRREPVLARLVTGVIVLSVVSTLTAFGLFAAQRTVRRALSTETELRTAAETAAEDAKRERNIAQDERATAEQERRKTTEALTRETALAEKLRNEGYFSQIEIARRALEQGDGSAADSALSACPESLRGFEWKWLDSQWKESQPTNGISTGEYSPTCVQVSPDGNHLFFAALNGEATVQHRSNTPAKQTTLVKNRLTISSAVDWEHHLAYAGTSKGEVVAWDFESGAVTRVAELSGAITALALSPTTEELAIATGTEEVVFWSPPQKKETARVKVLASNGTWWRYANPGQAEVSMRGAMSLCYSPDGKLIAAGTSNNEIYIVDRGTLSLGEPIKAHAIMPWGRGVMSLAFLSSGKKLVSGGRDYSIRVWGLDGKTLDQQFLGHTGAVIGLAASKTGDRFASASIDGTVRIWSQDGIVGIPRSHTYSLCALAADSDLNRIVAGSFNNQVKEWSSSNTRTSTQIESHKLRNRAWRHTQVRGIAFLKPLGPNDLCSIASDWNMVFYSGHPCRKTETLRLPAEGMMDIAVSPTRKKIALIDTDFVFHLGEINATQSHWRTPEEIKKFASNGKLRCCALHPTTDSIFLEFHNGTVLELSGDGERVLRQVRQPQSGKSGQRSLAVTPELLLLMDPEGRLSATQLSDNSEVAATMINADSAPQYFARDKIVVCSDFRKIAVIRGNQISIHELPSLNLISQLTSTGYGTDACFDQVGRRIVTTGRDGMLKLWDSARGRLLVSIQVSRLPVVAAAFADNDNAVIAGGEGGVVHVYEAN
jgi:serine/threonine protein kinase/WD40 repeat protein